VGSSNSASGLRIRYKVALHFYYSGSLRHYLHKKMHVLTVMVFLWRCEMVSNPWTILKNINRVASLRLSNISVPLVRSGDSSRRKCAYSWKCTVLMWGSVWTAECSVQRILILTVQRYAESDETYSWLLNAYKYTLRSHEAIVLFLVTFLCLSSRVSKHAALFNKQKHLKHILT